MIHRPTRRDRRHAFAPGAGSLTFGHPDVGGRITSATLMRISVAGVGFLPNETDVTFAAGDTLPEARIRIGSCEIHGEISVRSVAPDGEVGGLFFPDDTSDETVLMSLIAGVDAGRSA